MSFIVKESGSSFPPIPADTYHAVCYGLIEIGTHYNKKYDKDAHECIIMWEIPDSRITLKEGNEVARSISKKYTLSLGEKANLYKDLVSWRGRAFAKEELEGFDLKNLLGANCMIQVIHNESGGKVYANISAILPLYKGIPKKTPENEFVFFTFNESNTIPHNLPPWIKTFITTSKEWIALTEQGMGSTECVDPYSDDCPF